MHSVIPRLILAQRGSAKPQSQQAALPGIHWTRCRALSPFNNFSFVSLPDSRLPVEGDDFFSCFWKRNKKCSTLKKILWIMKYWQYTRILERKLLHLKPKESHWTGKYLQLFRVWSVRVPNNPMNYDDTTEKLQNIQAKAMLVRWKGKQIRRLEPSKFHCISTGRQTMDFILFSVPFSPEVLAIFTP